MKKAHNAKEDSRGNVLKKLAGRTGLDKARGLCELVGHSRLIAPGGRCARCLAPADPQTEDMILIGSPNTMANRAKLKAMTWKDKLYAPTNPFGEI